MYKVVYKFKDLQDNDYVYEVGTIYPRDGYKPTEERIAELASQKNKIGKVLIEEEVEIMPEPVIEEESLIEEESPIEQEEEEPVVRKRRNKN